MLVVSSPWDVLAWEWMVIVWGEGDILHMPLSPMYLQAYPCPKCPQVSTNFPVDPHMALGVPSRPHGSSDAPTRPHLLPHV